MNRHFLEEIDQWIDAFWNTEFNTLGLSPSEKAWDKPALAIAAGNDPLFQELKKDIGEFYWTPEEAFAIAFPGNVVGSGQLSVVSWVLPQTDLTKEEQRQQRQVPGRRWAASRFYGESFNLSLMIWLANHLCQQGVLATAPESLPAYSGRCHSDKYGVASNWSERHVAWVAGHGTFGLSDGLITRFGKAVRFGSLVVAAKLPVTPRSYQSYRDWCLFYSEGRCGACIKRCPAGAISETGHDKDACLSYISTVTTPYVNQHYKTGATPCGLCQVAIPCESVRPKQF